MLTLVVHLANALLAKTCVLFVALDPRVLLYSGSASFREAPPTSAPVVTYFSFILNIGKLATTYVTKPTLTVCSLLSAVVY